MCVFMLNKRKSKKSRAAALPQTPLRELTALPLTPWLSPSQNPGSTPAIWQACTLTYQIDCIVVIKVCTRTKVRARDLLRGS